MIYKGIEYSTQWAYTQFFSWWASLLLFKVKGNFTFFKEFLNTVLKSKHNLKRTLCVTAEHCV